MFYLDNDELKIEIGDSVLIEKGKTSGVIIAILETQEQIDMWDVDSAGLVIESKPFGAVFWPIDDHDPVLFVSRSGKTV